MAGGICVQLSSLPLPSSVVLARQMCTTYTDHEILLPLVAYRLNASDKNPCVCPIGVKEVVRRIIAKLHVLSIIGSDIQRAVSPLQFCAGQTSGDEATIHSMRKIFIDEDSEGFLLVDTGNAFNSLNRGIALQNIRHAC